MVPISVLNWKLSTFCFLFSHHKGWEKRDSQIYHTLDGHYFITFYHIPFYIISPSPPDSLPFRYKSQILGLSLLAVCIRPMSMHGQLCSGRGGSSPAEEQCWFTWTYRAFLCFTSRQPFSVLSAPLKEVQQHWACTQLLTVPVMIGRCLTWCSYSEQKPKTIYAV